MKKLPRLYALSSIGKPLFWEITVNGNKYSSTHGYIDGKSVTDEWTECEGKNLNKTNETSPQEQAQSEALSKWTKKKEQGGYWEDIKDIHKDAFFSPQLAKKYEDYEDEINWGNDLVFVSPKLDGMRCIITKNGATSRNGKQIKAIPHIVNTLVPFFEKYPKTILDGELYCDRLSNDFNSIMSLAKQSKPDAEDFAKSERDLEYHIFDIPSIKRPFGARWDDMQDLFYKEIMTLNSKYFKLVPHIRVFNPKTLENHLNDWIKEGYEGLMLNLNIEYECKRTNGLLKYKLFQDDEFEILDIEEGDGNRAGMFGRAKLKTKKGLLFDSNARGNREFYRDLLLNKSKYIGEMATVRYQNLTPDGIPRFPVIIAIRNYE